MKKPVLVDIDDVACKLRPYLCKALCLASGKQIHYSDWTHNRLHEIYGMTPKELVKVMVDHEVLERAVPEQSTKTALEMLRDSKHETVLITKRGFHPAAEALTRDWFKEFDLHYDSLLIVPMESSKLELYKHYSDQFEALIDDQLENLHEAKNSGIVRSTHVINRPWNKTNNEHDRSYSLLQAVKKIVL